MAYARKLLLTAVGVSCLIWNAPTFAEPPPAEKKLEAKKKPEPSKFIRVKRDANDEPVALETATVRYVPSEGDSGVVVDLVAAVHVGDRRYYEALNKQFEQYDVLLYELVAPEGTRIPKGGRREKDSLLSMLHDVLKHVLDLESQTEQIDYTKQNFVHADLSPDKIAGVIKERGDDGLTLALGVAADLLRKQNLEQMKNGKAAPRKRPAGAEDIDPFTLLLDPAAPIKLKKMMAEQFEGEDGTGLGPTLETILIADRNKAALKVFGKELAKGKKKIGIFYGAAHMPDFERRLREEYGLKKQSEQWLTAWDLKPRRGAGLERLFKLLDQLDR